MDYEIVADYWCTLGEGPLWHPVERRLYWTDIERGRIFVLDPATGTTAQIYDGDRVGGFTFQADGGLLLFGDRGSIRHFDGANAKSVVAEIEAERSSRFNDVIADPEGRVFAGTMPIAGKPARLYRLDTDGRLTVADAEIGLSNGLTFSLDGTKLYYTDSGQSPYPPNIYVYDYDRSSGDISDRRVFHTPNTSDGIPDGMTIDHEGCIWSARWGSGCVIRLDPNGFECDRVELPARKITSVTFGGEDLSELYITSAGGNDRSLAENGPAAGALFRVRPGVHGLPECFSRL